MKEAAESVDGVDHAETYAYSTDNRLTSGKVDLYLEEEPGRRQGQRRGGPACPGALQR